MGGNGVFVRCDRRKPYRLFPDTSVHSLVQHTSNDLFVWKHLPVLSVEKGANVRGLAVEGAQWWGGSCVG